MIVRWRYPIGGLVAISVINDQFILAVTHNGSGIFNLLNGDRVLRDQKPNYPDNGRVNGIGQFSGQKIDAHQTSQSGMAKAVKLGHKCDSDSAVVIECNNGLIVVAESSELVVYNDAANQSLKGRM